MELLWGPYEWPKLHGFSWGYFTLVIGVIAPAGDPRGISWIYPAPRIPVTTGSVTHVSLGNPNHPQPKSLHMPRLHPGAQQNGSKG